MRWTPLKVSLLMVLSFSMALILFSFLFYKNINILLGFWGEEYKITFYLKTDATEVDKQDILSKLRADTEIDHVELIDRNKAAADFKKMFGEYSAGLISVDEMVDLIPESLIGHLKKSLAPEQKQAKLKSLKQSLSTEPFVEEVSYGGEWIEQFSQIDRALRIFGLTLCLVLSFAVCFISALMIRSLVDDSKSEIEVLSLLGATRWHIYTKYLRQFMFFFNMSIIVSVALTFAAYYITKNRFLINQGFRFISENLHFFNWLELSGLIAALLVFVVIGALLSLRSATSRLSLFSNE